jgi:hypothetical protein
MDPIARTYRLDPQPQAVGGYTITCLVCGSTSAHPADVAELFCARCDRFHEDPQAEGPADGNSRRLRRRIERAQHQREGHSPMSEMTYRAMAASAYHAYVTNVVGKNHQGMPLPSWEDLPPHRQVAWEAAVRQVEVCLLTPEDAAAAEHTWLGWHPMEEPA